MDAKNRFFTVGTYTLVRLEYLLLSAIMIGLAATHRKEVNWWLFVILIAVTDGIGYVVGAIAHHKKKDSENNIASIYYVLYNVTHSFFLVVGAIVIWWAITGPSWTMLALPIHMAIDRSVFGNFFKPIGGVSFEPELHPAFAEFEKKFEEARRNN